MDVVATATLFLTAIGLLIAYFGMPRENREDLLAFLRRVFGYARATAGRLAQVITTFIPFAVVGMSLYGIWLFWTKDDPIRRSEVVLVGMHMINTLFYTFLSAKAVSLWFEKREPEDASGKPTVQNEEAQQ